MDYLLEGLGGAVWFVIIMKAVLEFRFTLRNYNEDKFVGGSIIRTHQNLSGLIFIVAAALSIFVAMLQHSTVFSKMYGEGLWVTGLLVGLMFLYQVEMYSQERTHKFTRVGIIRMLTIKFRRTHGEID